MARRDVRHRSGADSRPARAESRGDVEGVCRRLRRCDGRRDRRRLQRGRGPRWSRLGGVVRRNAGCDRTLQSRHAPACWCRISARRSIRAGRRRAAVARSQPSERTAGGHRDTVDAVFAAPRDDRQAQAAYRRLHARADEYPSDRADDPVGWRDCVRHRSQPERVGCNRVVDRDGLRRGDTHAARR